MTEDDLTDLRLIALDDEDLAVVSAHLQDAVGRVGDLAFLPKERRFAALLNRFDWSTALDGDQRGGNVPNIRRRTALRFERVRSAQLQGIDLKDGRRALALLAIQFVPSQAPSGHVTLVFAGGAAIRLEVEYIEAELRDLAGAWAAKSRPSHPKDD
jgi:hypothetical protein